MDKSIRNHFHRLRDVHGKQYLYDLLLKRDEIAAAQINVNDSVRVIRALEVLEQTGESIAVKQKKHSFADYRYTTYKIGLKIDRQALKRNIELRTDKMIAEGLLNEVREVYAMGYTENLKPLQSLGYKQVIGFLNNNQDWESTVNLIKRDTWQYAKRQMTWFAADREINWFDAGDQSDIAKYINNFLSKHRYFH